MGKEKFFNAKLLSLNTGNIVFDIWPHWNKLCFFSYTILWLFSCTRPADKTVKKPMVITPISRVAPTIDSNTVANNRALVEFSFSSGAITIADNTGIQKRFGETDSTGIKNYITRLRENLPAASQHLAILIKTERTTAFNKVDRLIRVLKNLGFADFKMVTLP